MHRGFRVLPLLFVLSLVLTACPGTNGGGNGGAPQITSFTANPETITAAGQAVALSWTVTNGVTSLEIDNGVGGVSGTSEVVYPDTTTTYTLTASNSSGTDEETVEVTVGPGVGPTPGPGAEDGLPPTLNTFGVSLEQTDFQSDQGGNIEDADDPRIVRVQPNGTFYAVVSASDPGGIAGVTIILANSSPPGLKADLAEGQSVGGFTLNGEVSGCVLDGTQTSVTCVYEIAAGNIPNVTALPGVSGEFAYVFRTRVADASGLESDTPPRGYVIVGDGGGTPNPPPGNPPPGNPPPGNPPPGNPPANRAPNADFTFDQQGDTLTVAFSGARSSDPDGDSLKYAWTFGDGKTATSRDFRNTYAKADKYKVSLKVTDPDGKSDTETKTVTVAGSDTPNPPPGNPTTYALEVKKAGQGSGTVKGTGINCGSDCEESYKAGTKVTLTATFATGSTFAGWSGACTNATGVCEVTMSEAKTVTATFDTTTTTTYELKVEKAGMGSGGVVSDPTGIDCGTDCTESYKADAKVTLTATAAAGSTFAGWSGACTNATGVCEVTMSEAKTVTATFDTTTTTTYELKVEKAGMGSGGVVSDPTGIDCGTDCTESYKADAKVTLTATAAAGSTFAGWSGACTNATGVCEVTMSEAKTVTATFDTTTTMPEVPGDSDLRADFEYKLSGTKVKFTSNTEGSNGNVLSYSWEFGDGMIGSEPKTSHTYAKAGTYKVFLTARTDDGADSRISKDVTVTN